MGRLFFVVEKYTLIIVQTVKIPYEAFPLSTAEHLWVQGDGFTAQMKQPDLRRSAVRDEGNNPD